MQATAQVFVLMHNAGNFDEECRLREILFYKLTLAPDFGVIRLIAIDPPHAELPAYDPIG